MKKITSILAFLILLAACYAKSKVSAPTSPETIYYKWGYTYYPTAQDSLNPSFISPGIMFDKNCFPSDFIDTTNVLIDQVSVFSRWGEVLFNTNELKTNWICNSDQNTNYMEGTYIYQIEYHLPNSIIDTVYTAQGQVYISQVRE